MRTYLLGGTSLLASLLLASVATAQLPSTQVYAAGHGAQKLFVDAETATGSNLLLGVVYLNGEYYVSGRDDTAAFHQIFVFDAAGVLVRQFDQTESTTTSVWGYRDGATDGVSLLFGNENGIFVIDTAGALVANVIANNGAQVLAANPITGPGLPVVGTYRGVAYDPAGNGGNGSIWTGSFGSDLIEIDLSGNILTQWPLSNWSIYGLAMDPDAGTLWANSIPNAGPLGEIDPATGLETGATIARNQAGSAQGGLSIGPADLNGTSLVGLDQGTPDAFTVYRNHLYKSLILGKDEPRLMTSVNGDPLSDSNFREINSGDTVEFGVTTGPRLNPTIIFFNFAGDAMVNGTTILLPGIRFPELVALSPISSPTGLALYSPQLTGGTIPATVPVNFLASGDLVRLQAMTLVPGVGYMASNQIYHEYIIRVPARGVLVEAIGTNSFNSDPTAGFFKITHPGGAVPAIQEVTFDWVASSNPAQGTMVFDTDQGSMADVFEGGNGTMAGCLGTYRNGSDVAAGLIYDAMNTVPATPCDPLANTGWIGTNGTVADAWKTLQFRFTPGTFNGVVFEFDCDTDGGAGITGGAMDGMVVTVLYVDGVVTTFPLVADPTDPNRSFADL